MLIEQIMYSLEVNENFRLGKAQKLKSSSVIKALYAKGQTKQKGPLRIKYLLAKEGQDNAVAFVAPKRSFSRAVDRNRLKRQLREAYRLNQSVLRELEQPVLLLCIYRGKELTSSGLIFRSMNSILHQIVQDENNKEQSQRS